MGNSNSKQTLIRLLTFIRDCEAEKPLDEMNMGLIEACVNLLLKLQKKEIVFTTEQIKERVRKIPFVLTPDFGGETTKKVKKHTTKKKILLVAAIIALLAMLMGVVYSNSKDEDFFRNIVETIGIDEIVFGETYTNDGISYQENEYIEMYEDINDYPEDNPYDILLPTYLPEGVEMISLVVTDIEDASEIIINCNTPDFGFIIYSNSKTPHNVIDNCNEVITTNGLKLYINSLPDIGTHQIHFEHKDNYYILSFTDKQELLKVIENLEE